jgi:glutathione synthase/RimK-type ligase-like ATP-grasp enzyme
VHAAAVDKPEQLVVAKRCGLVTPPTLVSNTPSHVRNFIERFGPKVVAKPMQWGQVGNAEAAIAARTIGRASRYSMIYTSLVGLDDLTDNSVSMCPVIYQKHIEKAFELRITIIGDVIFAAAMDINQVDPTLGDQSE